jgi:hypothetical protein
MLPVEYGTFFGVGVSIDLQTRSFPEAGEPPKVNANEKALVKSILSNLIPVLQEAERNFEIFNTQAPEAMSLVSDPHIWIDRSRGEEGQPNEWDLVIGVKEAPDFGFHIEFKGLEYRGIWAGD